MAVFEDYLKENFSKDKADNIRNQVDWETWVHAPGLAPVHLDFKTKDITESQQLASKYVQLRGKATPTDYAKYLNYYSSLKVVFLEQLAKELKTDKDAKAIMA